MTTRRGFLAGLLATAAAPVLARAVLPARAGMAYYAFGSFDLAQFGERIPNMEFEVHPATLVVNSKLMESLRAEIEESPGLDGWVYRRKTGRAFGRLLNGQEVEVRPHEMLPT